MSKHTCSKMAQADLKTPETLLTKLAVLCQTYWASFFEIVAFMWH